MGCKISPFLLVLIICLILGAILVVVPIFSFKSIDYVYKEQVTSNMQFGVPQLDYYDSLVLDSKQDTKNGLYVFSGGYEKKLNATQDVLLQIKTITAKMAKGDCAVISFHYLPQTYLEVTATGDDGVEFNFTRLDKDAYSTFESPSGKIIDRSDAEASNTFNGNVQKVTFKMNETYTTWGMHYAILENKGQLGNVTFSLQARTPKFTFPRTDALAYCENVSSCKLQKLPRQFFALAYVEILESSTQPNVISVYEQYRDWVRWTFPVAIYSFLILTVIVAGIIQLALNARKKNTPNSYSAIQDPLEQAIN